MVRIEKYFGNRGWIEKWRVAVGFRLELVLQLELLIASALF